MQIKSQLNQLKWPTTLEKYMFCLGFVFLGVTVVPRRMAVTTREISYMHLLAACNFAVTFYTVIFQTKSAVDVLR